MPNFQDNFYADLAAAYQEGTGLDEVQQVVRAKAERYTEFTPAHETALTEAYGRFREYLDRQIEYLSPATIRAREDAISWYLGQMPGDLHWPLFRRCLLTEKNWGEPVVQSIDRASDEVLSLLGNPSAPEMDTRGLVLGHVQSGKTANMAAVIAKAADRGYTFIILLAGMTNSLRLQTQRRLEDDVTGSARHNWEWLTTRDEFGDFATPANGMFSPLASEMRRIAVVKKNVSPLAALIRTLRATQEDLLRKVPFLVIDDECDQASVNGTGTQYDMTRINGQIRELLGMLPRVTYVGYSATPFANIFINPFRPGTEIPEDLYPRDFIKALDLPQGYFGTERLFGRDPVSDDDEGADGLDMIRTVDPNEVERLRPAGAGDRFNFNAEMTPSLEAAVRWYLLASAARAVRGQGDDHSCMLVHTTIFTHVHNLTVQLLREYLMEFSGRLVNDPQLRTELSAQWESETARVPASDWQREPDDPDAVMDKLAEIIGSVEVLEENAVSDRRLDFESGPKRYIVVGGSVLSRGLTIEGLVVSLFIRSSGQYDTLMQMGRWFGYRFGYEDLPRIWTTLNLSRAFRDLATVESEIRDDIRIYAESGHHISPLDFAVRIRKIPGLRITARAKMITTEECDISYSGEHVQTFRFRHRDSGWLRHNWEAGSTLINQAIEQGEDPEDSGQGRYMRNVPAGIVLDFLNSYRVHETHRQIDPGNISDYIVRENGESGSLASWTIAVVEPGSNEFSREELGGFGPVRTVKRAKLRSGNGNDADIKSLMSKRDLLIDISGEAFDQISWQQVKDIRAASDFAAPLLLLYAIDADSEPRSDQHRERLDAERDVLGIGISFPDLGSDASYVQVRLPEPDDAGDEDLDALISEEPVAAITDEEAAGNE